MTADEYREFYATHKPDMSPLEEPVELFDHPWRMMDTPILFYIWWKMIVLVMGWSRSPKPQPKDEYE